MQQQQQQQRGVEWQSLLLLARRSPAAALALRHMAAVLIQSHYRGAVIRKKYVFLIETRRAIDRVVPQLALSLLEESYLAMSTAVVLEVMEENSSRRDAEMALQAEAASIYQDVALAVVYDEVRQYIVPKAIREVTDMLIRKERKPVRINPLVAVVEDVLTECGKELATESVIAAIRDVTDEYLLQAKAEWVLEEIVTAVVQPFVQDSVNAELQEFMNYKEQWVGEEVIDSIARDVVSETYEAAKRLDAETRKEEILKNTIADHVNRAMWSRLAGVHLAQLILDDCSAIVARRELRDVAHALAVDRLLKLVDEGEAKVLRLRNNFMMREMLKNFTRDVVGPVLVEELVKRLSGSAPSPPPSP